MIPFLVAFVLFLFVATIVVIGLKYLLGLAGASIPPPLQTIIILIVVLILLLAFLSYAGAWGAPPLWMHR